VDEYLCASFEMDKDNSTYISKYSKQETFFCIFLLVLVAFNPSATSKDAHHMLLYGCTEPGSHNKIW
jgi:hypothetical protein